MQASFCRRGRRVLVAVATSSAQSGCGSPPASGGLVSSLTAIVLDRDRHEAHPVTRPGSWLADVLADVLHDRRAGGVWLRPPGLRGSSVAWVIRCAGHVSCRSSVAWLICCAGHPVRWSCVAPVMRRASHVPRWSSVAWVIRCAGHVSCRPSGALVMVALVICRAGHLRMGRAIPAASVLIACRRTARLAQEARRRSRPGGAGTAPGCDETVSHRTR